MERFSLQAQPNCFSRLPQDFSIIVGRTCYKCHLAVASAFSPKIRLLTICDPTCRTIETPFPDENGDFKFIMSYMYGSQISINPQNVSFIYQCAKFFDSQRLIETTSEHFKDNINSSNVFITLNQNLPLSHVSQEVKYIVKNFDALKNRPEMFSLPLYIYDAIFRSNNLSYGTEESLFLWMHKLVVERGNEFVQLFAHLIFEDLNAASMQLLKNSIPPDAVGGALWTAIRKRLIFRVATEEPRATNPFPSLEQCNFQQQIMHRAQSVPTSGPKTFQPPIHRPESLGMVNNSILLPVKPNDQFNGIFNYLYKLNNKSPCAANLVHFNAGGGQKSRFLSRLIEYDDLDPWWNNYNGSGFNRNDQWISVQFTKHRVCLAGYTFSSPIKAINSVQPKSWRILGSNDQENWQIVDEVINNEEMNHPSAKVTFYVKKPTRQFYSIFRIEQIANHVRKPCNDQYQFCLNAIEFFGSIEEMN